jgi:hypothetical protein
MGLLYGRAGRLTSKNGGFRPGQLLDRHISGTPRLRRAEVAETAEAILQQLQEAETEGRLAARGAIPVLQQANILLARHASKSQGTVSTMRDVDSACRLLAGSNR